MLASIVIAASALAATVSAQGVTSKITPTAAAPAGCTGTMSKAFNIAVVNVTSASSKHKRATSSADALTITLNNGVLTDSENRTGYIAANNQFQFDNPVQTGAIYTAGFSICANGTLALGGSTIWYECLSGNFYNLYDENVAAQCVPIFIDAIAVASGSSSASSTTSAASQLSDGQVQATTPASSLASSSTSVVSQITDGQIQATTPASSLASSTKKTSSTAVVSQITDGQIQATTGASAAATTVAAYTGGAAIQTAAPAAAALGLAALFML